MLKPNKEQKKRLAFKKKNLETAKDRFFPFTYKVKNKKPRDVKIWLLENRYSHWNQKGIQADVFTVNYRTLYFKDKIKFSLFLLQFNDN